MAKNYVQDGTTIEWVNSTGKAVASGAPVQVGNIVGVAHADIAPGETGVLHMSGVFQLPKNAPDAWVAGTKVYLIPATGLITIADDDGATTPAAYPLAGSAWSGVSSGDALCLVRLGY
ncbi:DUF2190 family protein [Cronobacter muytjensii]|uniref:DUF2190 family protein n=1 Tax=Cronobacter muytjensii TaxID=413501 RepID=UPI002DB9B8AD|nr:DUF2190 family protein [Cronobacter muytjensii]MEB8638652.1 DUF2190 family protein [Cronobacter muytjensii]